MLAKARTKVLDILADHHPRGIAEATEAKLLDLIDRYAVELGISGYERPPLPR